MCFATALAVDVKGRGFFFSIRHPRLSDVLAPGAVSQIGSFKSMDVISC